MAWLSGWKKRVPFAVSNANIDANLPYFAVLAYLSAACGVGGAYDVTSIFDELQSDANRKKIAVTKADGVTQLYVEIVKWDDASEKAWLWISKSDWTVLAAATTPLYIYYDVGHADNTSYVGDTNSTPAENVWDASFVGVYHMADGADNQHIYDSTGNSNDGTKDAAGAPAETPGMVGEAQDYDGDNDRIAVANHATLNFGTGDIDVLALVNSSGFTDSYAGIFSKYAGAAGYVLQLRKGETPYLYFYVSAGGGNYRDARYNTPVLDGNSHLLGGRRASNEAYVLLDGIDVTVSRAGTLTTHDVDNTEPLEIGCRQSTYYFEELMDEVFVSKIARSWAWHKAIKHALWDNLLTYGSEELAPHLPRHGFVNFQDPGVV